MINVIKCDGYLSYTNNLFSGYCFFCKLFSFFSKLIHALLASKRRLIDLQ
mgnify:CR=1 FL=1